MGKKCCQKKPRCKDCPKRKGKGKGKGKKASVAVDGEKRPIFYFAPLADMSISGQRG